MPDIHQKEKVAREPDNPLTVVCKQLDKLLSKIKYFILWGFIPNLFILQINDCSGYRIISS
jgi:hypothetical protein